MFFTKKPFHAGSFLVVFFFLEKRAGDEERGIKA